MDPTSKTKTKSLPQGRGRTCAASDALQGAACSVGPLKTPPQPPAWQACRTICARGVDSLVPYVRGSASPLLSIRCVYRYRAVWSAPRLGRGDSARGKQTTRLIGMGQTPIPMGRPHCGCLGSCTLYPTKSRLFSRWKRRCAGECGEGQWGAKRGPGARTGRGSASITFAHEARIMRCQLRGPPGREISAGALRGRA